jgi:glucose-1-phosphate thymidylyltransferase
MHNDLVGVIPAAGTASRLGVLPCSKELIPLGFDEQKKDKQWQPKAVSHYLLERMQAANVSKAYIILRKGKWDIPNYYGDGKMLDMHIAYLLMGLPFGVPFTVDQAYPFIKDSTVVFGFPDIIFEPKDAFNQLLARQKESNADIVLGIFKARQTSQEDMVDINADGHIRKIEIKPSRTKMNFTWLIAVWTRTFTNFMHDHLSKMIRDMNRGTLSKADSEKSELFMGDIFQTAIENNMKVNSVLFPKSRYLDIGTPENLMKASPNMFTQLSLKQKD